MTNHIVFDRESVRITEWPTQDRPRERMLAQGPRVLTDAELLAVFLRTGTRGRSAVDLARDLMTLSGSLRALLSMDQKVLLATPGMGPAKLAPLMAAMELARRLLQETSKERSALSSPSAVRDYLRLAIGSRDREVFLAIWLDAQHRALKSEELFVGTLTQTSVYPREVVKAALQANAAAVILAHNHPSGVAEPSHADEMLTRTLKSALALVDVHVLDHFVVTGAGSLSFAERGIL